MQEQMSRPVWGAWIEMDLPLYGQTASLSRPVWGAWIEIPKAIRAVQEVSVAPRMGRVD